ncbi:hypothetical protein D3C78_1320030 [compost metagenome]
MPQRYAHRLTDIGELLAGVNREAGKGRQDAIFCIVIGMQRGYCQAVNAAMGFMRAVTVDLQSTRLAHLARAPAP